MFYFIPSWYNSNRKWYDNEGEWHRVSRKSSFDDTVSQIKMFSKSDEDVSLIVLNYRPSLRNFLHDQGVQNVNVWSLFDDIQNIKCNNFRAFDYKSLLWPSDVEYIFSPFVIIVKRKGELYAVIQFNTQGSVKSIELKENNQTIKEYVVDDRGFLSSIIYYNEGIQSYQQYLNIYGIVQFTEYLLDGHVEISTQAQDNFDKTIYDNMDELIEERLRYYIENNLKENDVVVVAADKIHNNLVGKVKGQARYVMSFFGNRYELLEEQLLADVKNADLLVTDTEYVKNNIENILGEEYKKPTIHISPYDTRLALGISQRYKELEIYVSADNTDVETLVAAFHFILEKMLNNDNIRLVVGSYNKNWLNFCEKLIDELIDEHYEVEDFVIIDENNLTVIEKIKYMHVTSDNDVIAKFMSTRLIIDLSSTPDIFTQIAGISSGIPQINIVESMYVYNNKNGKIVTSGAELDDTIDYYFESLRNWNEALVHSVRQIEHYTSGKLVAEWKKNIYGE